MSKHSSPVATSGEPALLDGGLEAFHSDTESDALVGAIDGHRSVDHVAQIYESDDERFDAAVPVVRHGLERGERVMYVLDDSSEAEVTAALRDGGIDVADALESGALSLHTVGETYLRHGEFDPDEMLEFYADRIDEATDEYAGLRIVAETSWLRGDDVSVEQFMEYEARINELFADSAAVALCQYDRSEFAPAVIRTVVQIHPYLVYDGTVCHNVYYTPPAEFFGENAPAREVDRMLGTLRDRAAAKHELRHRDRFVPEL